MKTTPLVDLNQVVVKTRKMFADKLKARVQKFMIDVPEGREITLESDTKIFYAQVSTPQMNDGDTLAKN
jgi:hypothetical protein